MGLKTLATTLSNGNIRTRDGGRWGISAIHQILTRSTYIDEHRFNTRDHKTRQLKPESDPPSFQWTPMLAFRSWRGVSDECSTPGVSGFVQARGL